MKPRPAKGTKACLLYCGVGGEPVIRVYGGGGQHTDYLLAHCDMDILIVDSDAYFYAEDTENPYLDYSPQTLGIYEAKDDSGT